MNIKFNKDPLTVEQNNYATKIVDEYIAYDLDNWPYNRIRNFSLKSCLFGATIIVKNSDKEKWLYIGYGIAFDGKCTCSFGNNYAWDVIMFGADNNSSSHADNCKNNFLVSCEGGPLPEKNFSINFTKAKINSC